MNNMTKDETNHPSAIAWYFSLYSFVLSWHQKKKKNRDQNKRFWEKEKKRKNFVNIYIINRIKRPREWKKAAYL